MRGSIKAIAVGGVILAWLAGPGMVSQGIAQEEAKLARSSRGGTLSTVEGHRFEVFFYPTGVRVFPLDATGKPVDATRLSGHATFYHPNDPDSPWFTRSLHPAEPAPDHFATSLDLSVDLAGAPREGVTVHFEIVGLESKTSSTAEFNVPLSFVAMPSAEPTMAARTTAGDSAAPTQAAFGSPSVAAPEVRPLSYVQPTTTPTYGTDQYRVFGMRYRDWSTGRTNLPLSRPWLWPRD